MTFEVPETEIVSSWRVSCDGSSPALGHPRVWLQIPEARGWTECGYCDKRFVHADFADEPGIMGEGATDRPDRDAPG